MTTPPTKSERPLWLTIIILLSITAIPYTLYENFKRINQAPTDFAFSLLTSGLTVVSAIGLWLMKRWGAVCYIVSGILGILIYILIAVIKNPIYLQNSSFWCIPTFSLLIEAAIIYAFIRLWRRGVLK